MNVVVCVKQIPDPADPGALDPETKTLVRDTKLILDESDSYGVEMALQLAEAAGGGEVTLVSMAPNNERQGLNTALAMGAAKAILVSDEALAGSDALGTAKVLAKAIARVEDADLILTATESSDGYTGTVPQQVAEHYLGHLRGRVDTAILGCTHYPLLAPVLAEVLPGVNLVDSASATAVAVRNALGPHEGSGEVQFRVTDHIERFRRVGERFFGSQPDQVTWIDLDPARGAFARDIE